MVLGRASPDPRIGSTIELRGGDASSLLNLSGVSKALSGERITAEKSPPAFLQIEPTRTGGQGNLLHPRVRGQPVADRSAGVAGEVVHDER